MCVGGILGHALCTGLAVMGGRIIATRISVRTVTLVRGEHFGEICVGSLSSEPKGLTELL